MASEIWGDEDHVFVHVPSNAAGKNRNARVFSTMDGSELESRPVPDRRNRVRTFGRYVLSWNYDVTGEIPTNLHQIVQRVLDAKFSNIRPNSIPADARQVLVNRIQLKDIFDRDKTAEWERTFAFDARATFVNDHEIAVYDPVAKRLQIFSILDGEPIVDYELKTGLKKVDSISVERRAGLYIATLSEESDGRRGGKVTYQPLTPKKLANMEVYGFDESGEMVWGVPAKLVDFYQPPYYAADLPILVFIRKTPATPKRKLETVILDARDGHVILTDSSFLDGSHFQVRGDQELNQVRVRVPTTGGGWKLEFTDSPRSPSPPYGYATDTTRVSAGSLPGSNPLPVSHSREEPVLGDE
jgi:hypothetical protein